MFAHSLREGPSKTCSFSTVYSVRAGSVVGAHSHAASGLSTNCGCQTCVSLSIFATSCSCQTC